MTGGGVNTPGRLGSVAVDGGAMSAGGGTGVDDVAAPGACVTGGVGAAVARACCCGVIVADTFITLGSSGVTGAGLLALAPGEAVDSPS